MVRHLTVDCLLGADFLKRYRAIVDCGNSVLHLINRDHQYTISVTHATRQQVSSASPTTDAASTITEDFTVCAPSNISIPGQSVKFITGKLSTPCHAYSGLVDPLSRSPMHICVARSLSPLANGSDILLQVMNISSTPVTIYKGTKLATMVPEHGVMLVSYSTQPYNCHTIGPGSD